MSDEDEEEPQLKYSRLQGISEIVSNDGVSCFAVSDRLLALGTLFGKVIILDLLGTQVKSFSSHTASVNQVSIDTFGESVASASDDGNVFIYSLYGPEIQSTYFKRPVKGVALEPEYSKKSTRQFLSGGLAESLTLTNRGWFGNTNIVLHSGDGPILSLSWRGSYIVWANELGVNLYDVVSQQKFGKIERDLDSPRADLFRCSFCWVNDTVLLVAWSDSVKKIEIKDRSKLDVASGLPIKVAEVISQFRTEYVVCGIAPMEECTLLLGYYANLEDYRNIDNPDYIPAPRKEGERPELHVVDPKGETLSSDELELAGYEHYQANDYRLDYTPGMSLHDTVYYIVSPKDIVIAKPRDLNDHIQWLVERQKYGKALKAAEGAEQESSLFAKIDSIVELGQKHIGALLTQGKYDEAAAECPEILRQDSQLWERWCLEFDKAGQLEALYPFISIDGPRLSSTVYELFLIHFLNTDPSKLLIVVCDWPFNIYPIRNVIASVQAVQEKDLKNTTLLEILYELYLKSKQFDQALMVGLLLGKSDVLDLVERHNLFSYVQQQVVQLLDYASALVASNPTIPDPPERMRFGLDSVKPAIKRQRAVAGSRALHLLAFNTDLIPPKTVVDALEGFPLYIHIYLDALSLNESFDSSNYHDRQLSLYTEFDPTRLLGLLRSSTGYNITKAYEMMEKKDLVPEMVFLLGKMGNNRRALMLIIERLHDVPQAIEFAKQQDDDELWEEFLKYAMDKPAFIVGLLENVGNHINPLRIIERIPKGLNIPNLRPALIKILTDSTVQMSLREGCERILVSDTWETLINLLKHQRQGIYLNEPNCSICDNPIESDGLVVFYCHHVFHQGCLSFEETLLKSSPDPLHTTLTMSKSGSFGSIDKSIANIYTSSKDKRVSSSKTRAIPTKMSCPMCRSSGKTIVL